MRVVSRVFEWPEAPAGAAGNLNADPDCPPVFYKQPGTKKQPSLLSPVSMTAPTIPTEVIVCYE
jgi:hypothetical protein